MHMVIYISITILDIKWEILKFLNFASNFNSVLLKMIQLSGLLIGHKKDRYFENEAHVDLLWSYHAVALYFIFCVFWISEIFLLIHGCTKVPILLIEHTQTCWKSPKWILQLFYTPAPQRGRGVYCFTSVCLSFRPRYFSLHFSQ